MHNNHHFILYFTLGCHLCELAEEIIEQAQSSVRIQYIKVDVAGDDALVDAYGIRIPVLKNTANQQELNWPFTVEQVCQMLIQY